MRIRHRRVPLLVLVAGALVLSACGTRFLSPAATVDGRPISQDALQAELDLALSDPQNAQQVAGPGGTRAKADLARQALSNLIRREIAGEFARVHGIAVTQADVDRQLQATITQVGGQSEFNRLVQARDLTTAMVRELLADQVLLQKIRDAVVSALPTPPANPQEGDLAFQKWLSDRVARAAVSVNPRFGRFDHQSGEVVPITSTADLG
jgi:hypothetical protein